MTRLLLIGGQFEPSECSLRDGTLRVGRSAGNDIVIQDDSVSANHCELLVHGPEVIVRELGSRNGTYINGVRVAAQGGLNRQQILRIGRVEFRLDYPELVEDTTTDNTAMFSYRKVTQSAIDPPPAREIGTILFKPVGADRPDSNTIVVPRPLETRVADSGAAPSATGSGFPKWWVLAAFLSLLALLGWFLRR